MPALKSDAHTLVSCVCVCVYGTHSDKAVRLDLVDPEALLHHGAGSVEQLFELAQSEWANLWETAERSDHTGSRAKTSSWVPSAAHTDGLSYDLRDPPGWSRG